MAAAEPQDLTPARLGNKVCVTASGSLATRVAFGLVGRIAMLPGVAVEWMRSRDRASR